MVIPIHTRQKVSARVRCSMQSILAVVYAARKGRLACALQSPKSLEVGTAHTEQYRTEFIRVKCVESMHVKWASMPLSASAFCEDVTVAFCVSIIGGLFCFTVCMLRSSDFASILKRMNGARACPFGFIGLKLANFHSFAGNQAKVLTMATALWVVSGLVAHTQMDCVISNFHDYLIRWWVVTWWPVKHKIVVQMSANAYEPKHKNPRHNKCIRIDEKPTLFPCQMATQSNGRCGRFCILRVFWYAIRLCDTFKWLNTDRQTQFCIYLHFG